ncbi:MAG TPA: nucleotidyltransferase family protein [Acidimicrobiales bacterium]
MTTSPIDALVRTAHAMAIDEVTAEVVTSLSDAGIEVVLLKGPALAQWLYPDSVRAYGDTDLLVNPSSFSAAARVLSGIGFADPWYGPAEHAITYHRRNGAGVVFSVDLHRTIPLVTASPAALWREFSSDTAEITVARRSVRVLGVPHLGLHLAIHAVQHASESGGPKEDLRRAIDVMEFEDWQRTTEASRRMGAEDALAAGLCLAPGGPELAERLQLTSARRGLLRMASAELNPQAYQLQRLIDADGWQGRLRMLANPLFMSPAIMRQDSALARRGTLGLVACYAIRPFVLLGRLRPALAARRRILRSDD